MLMGLIDNGNWVVKQFEDEHSHLLASPSKILRISSHKRLTQASKDMIQTLERCGLRPTKISRVLSYSSGRLETVNISSKACSSQLAQIRKNNMGRQCMKVIEYFQHESCIDHAFFFKIEVDTDSHRRSALWVDYRSRNSYMQFGDVILFDVTNRTNAFKIYITDQNVAMRKQLKMYFQAQDIVFVHGI